MYHRNWSAPFVHSWNSAILPRKTLSWKLIYLHWRRLFLVSMQIMKSLLLLVSERNSCYWDNILSPTIPTLSDFLGHQMESVHQSLSPNISTQLRSLGGTQIEMKRLVRYLSRTKDLTSWLLLVLTLRNGACLMARSFKTSFSIVSSQLLLVDTFLMGLSQWRQLLAQQMKRRRWRPTRMVMDNKEQYQMRIWTTK